MIFFPQKMVKILCAFGMLAFISIGFLGLSHFTMSMHEDGSMALFDCPLMSGVGVCNMSILEHLSSWQILFATILHPVNALSLAVLFSIFTLLFMVVRWRIVEHIALAFFYKLKIRRQKAFLSLIFFQELFSRGILHPKLF